MRVDLLGIPTRLALRDAPLSLAALAAKAGGDRYSSGIARVQIALSVVVFAVLLDWIYVNFLTAFSYMGFTYSQDSAWYMPVAPVVVFASSCFLPTVVTKLSHWMLWLLFWVLYAPIEILVPLQQIPAIAKWSFLGCLFVSFYLTVQCSRIRWPLLRLSLVDWRLGQLAFWALYLLLWSIVLSVFGGHLQLVGFEDVYKLRNENSELLQTGIVGYALANLAWAINPFLIAQGLIEKKKAVLAVGVVGQIVLYATLGHKGVLLSTVVVFGAYYAFLRRPVISAATISRVLVVLCAIPIIPYLAGFANDQSTIGAALTQLMALLYMRTLGMVAAATGVYIDFFQTHPYTYYSHVNIVSAFVHYPYQESLGEAIGFDLTGDELDANASFYATDGYAALGPYGVVLIGPIMGLFLSFANALCERSFRLACVAFVPFVMIVANTSLFTSLLTGGGLMLLLLTYLHRVRA